MEPLDVLIVTNGAELWGVERVRQALSGAGFRVLGVESADAKNAVLSYHPAVIIANLSGDWPADRALCNKLANLSGVPLIAMGSVLDQNKTVELIETVADEYLQRPVNPREVVAQVRSMLRRTQPERYARILETPVVPLEHRAPARSSIMEWIRSVIHRHP
jgi:DNA-binding response OmpR family regulator